MSRPAPLRGSTAENATLLLNRDVVQFCLSLPDCIHAVEDAFRRHALGESIAPGVLGTHVEGGGFHVKTAGMFGAGTNGRPMFAAKVNANFAERADAFAREMSSELGIEITTVRELGVATKRSDIWVTCTPARRWFLGRGHVAPGTFVAAVGADSPEKQEIEPELLAVSAVIVDMLDQCATIGDLHHALDSGVMRRDDVRAELADVVAGGKRGRESPDEVVVFDSTGTALQDVAAAVLVHERALVAGIGVPVDLAGRPAPVDDPRGAVA